MIYYNNTSELYHHGIKGQKWGVRRYEDSNGRLTPAGKERYYNAKSVRFKNVENMIKGSGIKTGKIISNEVAREAVIEVGAFATVTALSVGISKLYEKHAINKDVKVLKTDLYEERTIKDMSDLPKLNHKESPKESMKKTNPTAENGDYCNNCTLCTTAMVMRQKGYDVTAKKIAGEGHYDEIFPAMFDGAVSFSGSKKKAKNYMLSCGDGAYGHLGVNWTIGGGHSMFWRNDKGIINIYDGQSGEKYSLGDIFTITRRKTWVARLDNCTPNKYTLGLLNKGENSNDNRESNQTL